MTPPSGAEEFTLASIAPPRQRPRWPLYALLAAVLVAAGVVTAVLVIGGRAGGEDSGVAACRIPAQVADEGRVITEDESRRMYDGLSRSTYADLRQAGERLHEVAADPDPARLAENIAAGLELARVCRAHGVTVQPGG